MGTNTVSLYQAADKTYACALAKADFNVYLLNMHLRFSKQVVILTILVPHRNAKQTIMDNINSIIQTMQLLAVVLIHSF